VITIDLPQAGNDYDITPGSPYSYVISFYKSIKSLQTLLELFIALLALVSFKQ